MKRLSLIVVVVSVIATLFLIARLQQPVDRGLPVQQDAFDGFAIDRPQVIELGEPETESGAPTLEARYKARAAGIDLEAAARREQLDQIRDWLLITVLSAARLSVDDLNQALYDLPPVRRSQFDRIARFEYGDTRTRTIGSRDVVALVPAGSSERRTDALAQILDEQRKNTGQIPHMVHVFEYELATDLGSATVTRRAPMDGRQLFTVESGYVERRITSLPDLNAFVGAVDDLVYANTTGDALTVGGRRVRGGKYRGITVEDVATIWQSEQSREGREHGSGFSLDPQFDFRELRRTFEGELAPRLRKGGAPESLLDAAGKAVAASDIGGFVDGLTSACESLAQAKVDCAKFARSLAIENQFQAARYDGRLQGTEVGMVLFYTDLLMKLWAQDYERGTPRAVAGFPNRVAMEVAAIYRSEVEDFPNTRLWLGSLDEGYQVSGGGRELLFSRTATRVFAVPNDPFTGKDRVETTEPHVYNRMFMTWWNDHYAEVARYEPEYERLNEIMKWSQTIVWLNTSGRGTALSFLESVSVDRSKRFTEWVRRHPELTFRNWNAVRFKPSGYGGSTTEALDILQSQPFVAFGEKQIWKGGVSLARRAEFVERASLAEDVPTLARRARLDYSKSRAASGELRTLQSIEYKLQRTDATTALTVARVPTTQRLRGLLSEFKHSDVERTIARAVDDLVIRTRAVQGNVGDFHVTRTPTGFRAAWNAREIDRGRAIATRASMAGDIESTLVHDPDVTGFVRLADDAYLVRALDADRWMRITRAPNGSKVVRAGFDGRISGTGSNARPLDVAWVDDAAASQQIGANAWLRLASDGPSERAAFIVDSRGPPAGAQVKTAAWGDRRIAIAESADGRRAVRAADLPTDLRQDLGGLRALLEQGQPAESMNTDMARLVENGQFQSAARALADNPNRFRAAVEGRLSAERRTLTRLLDEGHFTEARRRADGVLAVWGDRPEFRVQRALAQLGEGDAGGAARTLQTGFRRPADRAIFDEINKRIADPTLSESARTQLADARSVAYWHSDKAANAKMPGELVVAADREGLHIEYRIETMPSRSAEVAQIDPAALVYVEDTPGLNNIDWSPSTLRPTLQSLVSGRTVHIELLQVDLARYRPARITIVKRQKSLTRVTPRRLHASSNDDCGGTTRDSVRCQAYVVTTEPAVSNPVPR